LRILEEHIFRLKDDILYAVFEEGGVVLRLEDRVSHEINRTGASILTLLDGERNVGSLIQMIAREYGRDEKVVREDVMDFLKNLMKRGWVYVKRNGGDTD
jgi:hypothetical protein